MTVKTRVYVVDDVRGGISALVRAGSKNAAINFKARAAFTAVVASQDDIIEALGSGAKIEDATEAPPEVENETPAPAAAAPAAAAAPPVKPAPVAKPAPTHGKAVPATPAPQPQLALETPEAPPRAQPNVRRQPPPPPPPAVIERMDLSDEGEEEIL